MEPSPQLQQQRHFDNFLNSIRAQATRKSYQHYFKKYQQFTHDNLFRSTEKEIEQQVIDFLLSLKKRDLSFQHIKNNFAAIAHFYIMNDVNLNTNKINRFIASQNDKRKKTKNIGYTSEQIRQLLNICDERTKAMILLYASSGMRLGALPALKVGDLELIKDPIIYKITVYQGYKEEYITFCTPECTNVLNSYFEYRKRCGESLTDNSPVIREQFNTSDPLKTKYARFISIPTITKTIRYKFIQAGLRIEDHPGDYSGARFQKDVPLIHGFRKFFNTALLNADVHYSVKELLMGHSIKLDDVYYHKDSKKSQQKLLDEYCKAIDLLTINEENRLKRKVEMLSVRADRIADIEREMDEIRRLIK